MKLTKKELKLKIYRCLADSFENHLTAPNIAKICNISIYQVYSVIRSLREFGCEELDEKHIGIHHTKKGYVLSVCATMQDDVEYMRRLNGARTSVHIAARAAYPHIKTRWVGVEDKKAFNLIMHPLNGGGDILKRGMKILIAKTKAGI